MITLPFIIRYAEQLATNTPAQPESDEEHPDKAINTVSRGRSTRETRVRQETTDDE